MRINVVFTPTFLPDGDGGMPMAVMSKVVEATNESSENFILNFEEYLKRNHPDATECFIHEVTSDGFDKKRIRYAVR